MARKVAPRGLPTWRKRWVSSAVTARLFGCDVKNEDESVVEED